MKKYIKQISMLIAICFIGSSRILHAQSIYRINDSKDNAIKLSGTSTLRAWTMITQTFSGEAQFGFTSENDHQLISIKSLTFSLEVMSLKSGKNGLDKSAYKALKTGQYKTIIYTLTSAEILSQTENKYMVRTQGNLSIAGVTKEVIMDVYCIVNKDETITYTGFYQLNMTDYQVKPPAFMLGIFKTNNAVTLDFTAVYEKINEDLIR
jgi:polyisoprenoid-binding protein YceI